MRKIGKKTNRFTKRRQEFKDNSRDATQLEKRSERRIDVIENDTKILFNFIYKLS